MTAKLASPVYPPPGGPDFFSRRANSLAYTVPGFLCSGTLTPAAGNTSYAKGWDSGMGSISTRVRVFTGVAFTGVTEAHIAISDGTNLLADSGDVSAALMAYGAGSAFIVALSQAVALAPGESFWGIFAAVGTTAGTLKALASQIPILAPPSDGQILATTRGGYAGGVPNPVPGSGGAPGNFAAFELLP